MRLRADANEYFKSKSRHTSNPYVAISKFIEQMIKNEIQFEHFQLGKL